MSGLDKSAQRQAAFERRAAVGAQAREAFAERLALQGVEIARKALAGTVAAYWPIGAEADTRYLLEALAYHQFAVALPVVVARGRPLLFRRWTPRDRLVEGPYGVLEPSARAPEAQPDLIFAPLAGFDRRGHRIGYGGGYYDLTLRDLRARKHVLAVGVAYGVQEVAEVAALAHDERLDFVLTDGELIDCRALL